MEPRDYTYEFALPLWRRRKLFELDELDTKGPDELGANYFAHTPMPNVLVLVDDAPE